MSVLLLFAVANGYSQINLQKSDSLRLKTSKEVSEAKMSEKGSKDYANGQQNGNNMSNPVKQIKSRRPDMSRARGARPPMIVRPSGSGIPKGVGKPGGVGRKGGR